MSRITITVEGIVAQDPVARTTGSGKTVTNVSVPISDRRRNPQGEYEQVGDTLWCSAAFWDDMANVVAAAYQKGDLVTLTSSKAEIRTYDRNGSTAAELVLPFATIAKVTQARKRAPQQNRGWDTPATSDEAPW